MSFRLTALLFTAALGLAAAMPAAQAQTTVKEVIVRARPRPTADREVKSQVVKFADLDLDAPAGAETLVGRIRGAAVQVCAPTPHLQRNFKDVADYRHCTESAMARAVQDVMNPLVQQVYDRTMH